MKCEENRPRGSEEKSLKCVDGQRSTTDGRTTTDDGLQVITIAHPEPSAQVSSKSI